MNKIAQAVAVTSFVFAAFSTGCSSGAYRSQAETKARSNQAAANSAAQAGKSYSQGKSTVVNFDPGHSDLSDAAKLRLRDIVTTLGVTDISRVEVASWSDKAFPKSGPDLSKSDVDLADKRASSIENFLKKDLDLSTLRIRDYNMAETSNWMARTFRTDESELKSVFSKDSEAPVAREDFNIIMTEGGPNRAVIVFIRK